MCDDAALECAQSLGVECFSVRVDVVADKGRGLLATADLGAGSVVLRIPQSLQFFGADFQSALSPALSAAIVEAVLEEDEEQEVCLTSL